MADARAEIERITAANPRLAAFQEEIDHALDGCVDQQSRVEALSIMMGAKMMEMAEELSKLNAILKGLSEG